MVASAVYITDLKGKPIISRNYRGDIPPQAVEKFQFLIQDGEDREEHPSPVIVSDMINYVYIKHNNLYRKYPARCWAIAGSGKLAAPGNQRLSDWLDLLFSSGSDQEEL